MRAIIDQAVDQLCASFEQGGYNPTPIIDLGVLVANADGTIDTGERAMLLDVFQTLLGTKLTPEQVDNLISASVEVIQAAGVGPRARLVGAILDDCDAAEQGVRVALAIAYAAEGLSRAERAVVDQIAIASRLPLSRVDALAEEIGAHATEGPASVRNLLGAGGS